MKKYLSLFLAMALTVGAYALPANSKKQAFKPSAKAAQMMAAKAAHQPMVKHHVAKKNVYRAPQAFNAAAATFTFSSITDTVQTQSGYSLKLQKGTNAQQAPQWNNNSSHMRIYSGNTITVKGSDLTKITIKRSKSRDDKDYPSLTANKGNLVSGGTSTSATDIKTDTWTGNATEVIFSVASTQCAIYEVEINGEGGGGGGSDTIYISNINYGDAYYYTDEIAEDEYANFWDIDLYNDYDYDEDDYVYPDFYVMVDCEEATKIAGEPYVYYAGLWTSANDSVIMASGTITITAVEDGLYAFTGEFTGKDGKVYILNAAEVEVYAYDYDNDYEEIELTDHGTTGGDTITIVGQDAIEFTQYLSYSEEGAYNYSVNLYNSNDIYPYLALDIYTAQLGVWTGSYSEELTNIGEYSIYYPNEDSEGIEVSNLTITISENQGVYTVAGEFDGSDKNHYIYSTSAVPSLSDGDYPYEPMEAQATIQVSGTSIEVDDEYVADYGQVYYSFDTENGDLLTLTFITDNTQTYFLPDGTYSIDTVAESFYPGYYMNFLGYEFFEGATLQTEDAVYYFQSGTITSTTAADSTVTLTVNLTSAHGTQVQGTFTFAYPVPEPVVVYTCQEAYNMGMELDEPAKGKSTDGEEITVRGYVQYAYSASDYTQDAWLCDEKGAKAGVVKAYKCEIYEAVAKGDYVEVTGTLSRFKNNKGEDIIEVMNGIMEIIDEPTALEDVHSGEVKASKQLRDGQLLIEKNGVVYTVLGQIAQ